MTREDYTRAEVEEPTAIERPQADERAGLPHENPRTAGEVAENRRNYIEQRPKMRMATAYAMAGVATALAVVGAAGSIGTISRAAIAHNMTGWLSWAPWAGAEGVLLLLSIYRVSNGLRGQTSSLAVRLASWGATFLAVALNIAPQIKEHDVQGVLFHAAIPLATIAGIELLEREVSKTLAVAIGQQQYEAEAAQRALLVRADRWVRRAGRGGKRTAPLYRMVARRYAEAVLSQDPASVEDMAMRVRGFALHDGAQQYLTPPTVEVTVKRHDAGSEEQRRAMADTRPAEIEGPMVHPALPSGSVPVTAALAVNTTAWKGPNKARPTVFVTPQVKPMTPYPPSMVNGVERSAAALQEPAAPVPAKEIRAVPAAESLPTVAPTVSSRSSAADKQGNRRATGVLRRRPTLTHKQRMAAIGDAFPGSEPLSVYEVRKRVSGRDQAIRAALLGLDRWKGGNSSVEAADRNP
ncbi:DUF2637 domain-containing protein [Streptomyces sp. NPDC059861]|uniref:DUF2637 domain-containing protein n=1 Tax=Streptomyces sp. NPDC059861 TaxID=3346974 RepID=UPI003669537B